MRPAARSPAQKNEPMGTTFVAINERGFWMRDAVLELWLRLLALHLDDPPAGGLVVNKIRDGWLLASRGYFNGSVPDGLEEAVSTEEGALLVRRAIRSLVAALKKTSGRLGKDVFNVLGMTGSFGSDVETGRLIEVGQAFLDLIDGKVGSGPEDTSFMPGSW